MAQRPRVRKPSPVIAGAHQRKTGAITSRLIKLGFMTEGEALPSNSNAANERTEFAKSG
jgi:hypothetical protein